MIKRQNYSQNNSCQTRNKHGYGKKNNGKENKEESNSLSAFIKLFFLIIFSLSYSCFGNKEKLVNDKKPNVLFIFTDDQVFRSINALNNKEVYTPNLDRLANSSKVFTNIFNQGADGGAVCVYSRAMINSGLSLWKAIDFFKDAKKNKKTTHPFLGKHFINNNYQTFFTGKWHNGLEALLESFNYFGTEEGSFVYNNLVKDKKDIFAVRGMLGSKNNNDYRAGWVPDNIALGGHWRNVRGKTYHSSELITNSAIKFLREKTVGVENPFFMYVAYFAPHDPRQAPKKFLDLYNKKEILIPENFLPIYPFNIRVHKIRAEKIPAYPRTKEELQVHRRDYYAIISHLDEQIGKLLDEIEKHPEYKNTYIIFTSDHGLSMGEHGLYAKQTLFDHAQKVPFFIKGPKVKNIQHDTTPLNLYQLYSTLSELCGLSLPETVPNKSFANLIKSEKYKHSKYIYGAYKHHIRSVMNRNHKLLMYPLLKKVFLFDRNKDKWEINNIAKSNLNIVKHLFKEFKKLQIEFEDKLDPSLFNDILTWDMPNHNAKLELHKNLLKFLKSISIKGNN